MPTILGFETSCDETACAVVRVPPAEGPKVQASAVATQNELHAGYGGVVPEIAGRAHVERIVPILRRALAHAGLGLDAIDAVAVGHRPGLIGSLLVGVAAAKAAAFALGVPLVGVDHVHAHLIAATLDRERMPPMPALGLVVSGGHTALYQMDDPLRIRRLGSTRDDAIGEAYDKAASILCLAYPGGPRLDALAQEPGANDRAADLPVSRLEPGSLDFSFSGLKTAMLYAVRGVPTRSGAPAPAAPPPLTDARRRDLAASFQRVACEAVRLKVERAIALGPTAGDGGDAGVGGKRAWRSLLAGGGVTANSRLREELGALADVHGLGLWVPPLRYCLDNAAMIAALGGLRIAAGQADDLTLRAHPSSAT